SCSMARPFLMASGIESGCGSVAAFSASGTGTIAVGSVPTSPSGSVSACAAGAERLRPTERQRQTNRDASSRMGRTVICHSGCPNRSHPTTLFVHRATKKAAVKRLFCMALPIRATPCGLHHGVLGGLGDAELHDGLGRNLNRGAGGRVAALASLAVDLHELAEVTDGEHTVLLDFGEGERVEGVHESGGVLLLHAGLFGKSGKDLSLGQLGHSDVRFDSRDRPKLPMRSWELCT